MVAEVSTSIQYLSSTERNYIINKTRYVICPHFDNGGESLLKILERLLYEEIKKQT